MTTHTIEPATLRMQRPAVLVVDDHPANILAIESVLAPLPFRLVTACSGADAVRLAREEEFVLILMDVHMPGIDGFQTVDLLRRVEGTREAPVVFFTAMHDVTEFAKRAYALGAVDYITKPFDPEILRAKVQALVSLYTRGQRQERARREEMDRLKDLFLGAVGHDLRNPLNAIFMGARLLRMGHGCSDANHAVVAERIDRSARRMNEIIEDMVHLVRAKFAGEMPLKTAPADAEAICRAVIAEMRTLHPDRTVELEVHGDPQGQWDATRLARIVSNLVGNALKHTQERSVQVRIDGTGESVTLSVHNRGAAIPADVLPRLFEPFRRGNTSAEGVGLGLYIVSEIARAHGGQVDVVSNAEDGTTFSVTLPRSPLKTEARPEPNAVAPAVAPPVATAAATPAATPVAAEQEARGPDATESVTLLRRERLRLARARIRLLAILSASELERLPPGMRERIEEALREAQQVDADAAGEVVGTAATKAEQLIDLLTLGVGAQQPARA